VKNTKPQLIFDDNYFMAEALKEAMLAYHKNEVPVGAVVVCDDIIIAKAHNMTEILSDVTAHAEILAYTAAASYLGSKYLSQCTMYVTLEPCCMCAGALYWSQLKKLVYGASDNKRGAFENFGNMLHPSTTIEKGVMKNECAQIISDFFKEKRE